MQNEAKNFGLTVDKNIYNFPQISTIPSADREVVQVLRALLGNDYTQSSRRAIFDDLRDFIRHYTKKNGETFRFSRLVSRDIADYRDEIRQEGYAVASVNRKLVSIRLFCKEAIEQGFLIKNPASKVKQLALQSLAPKGLMPQETRKLLKEVELRGKLRDRLIIELLLGAGLRLSEVVKIRVQDISISERRGSLVVANSKGNKTRSVPLNAALRLLMQEYMASSQPTEHLFQGRNGRLASITVSKLVEKYARITGLHLSPHTLRHTYAYNFLKHHPGDVLALATCLGHESPATTMLYGKYRLEDLQEKVESVTY